MIPTIIPFKIYFKSFCLLINELLFFIKSFCLLINKLQFFILFFKWLILIKDFVLRLNVINFAFYFKSCICLTSYLVIPFHFDKSDLHQPCLIVAVVITCSTFNILATDLAFEILSTTVNMLSNLTSCMC